MPKIISERCELVKLCHIKRSSTVFLRHSVAIGTTDSFAALDLWGEATARFSEIYDCGPAFYRSGDILLLIIITILFYFYNIIIIIII